MKAWRAWLLGCLFALAATAAERPAESQWRLSDRAVREAVRATVSAQLAALQREDLAAAYAWAAEGIRRQFTEPVFAAMIRRGYPALLRHEAAELGVVRDSGDGRASVVATVRPERGPSVRYRYLLQREKGRWRVAGVFLDERPPERGDA
ncbi:MAG: DUF4864 domain-containing protein [Candidatus Didemnitutus sp.]|nr:DUF4864 domain-containing protein [Candidatus Didemnitutus sp.]